MIIQWFVWWYQLMTHLVICFIDNYSYHMILKIWWKYWWEKKVQLRNIILKMYVHWTLFSRKFVVLNARGYELHINYANKGVHYINCIRQELVNNLWNLLIVNYYTLYSIHCIQIVHCVIEHNKFLDFTMLSFFLCSELADLLNGFNGLHRSFQ